MKRAFVTGGSGFVGRALIGGLVARGIEVRALARSEAAAIAVRNAGAEPVRGDLDDVTAMIEGMRQCEVVFHAAAHVKQHGKLAEFKRTNVRGTENVLADGHPIVQADETRPYPARPAGPYPLTKALAEAAVLAANRGDHPEGLETVVIRPRFIWGKGDTSLLPELIAAVQAGKFAWVGDGHYPTSTCHVANVVEGALLAAEKGTPGAIYFLTDGPAVDFREFLTAMLGTQGVDPGSRTVPRWVASTVASLTSWMKRPPITKTAVALIGGEVTVDDSKARRELGYLGHVSREQGLAELRAARA